MRNLSQFMLVFNILANGYKPCKGMIAIIFVGLLNTMFFYASYAQQPIDYYESTVGLNGVSLQNELYNIINGHIAYPYDKAWSVLKESDENPNNQAHILLVYSGRSRNQNHQDKGGTYDYISEGYSRDDSWNREHVWPQSHGNFGYSKGTGTDIHNLKPVDFNVNSSRQNLDYDNGGSPHFEAIGSFYDTDSWEPPNKYKGDLARIIFYMATRYNGDNGEPDLKMVESVSNAPSPEFGKLSTLLSWNQQDPPDHFERRRNEVIFGWQKNRNPFIDNPAYADLIWNGMTASPVEITNRQQQPINPDPNDSVNILADISSTEGDIVAATLFFGKDFENLNLSMNMTATGDSYLANIPGYPEGERIYYKIRAEDENGNIDSVRADYIVENKFSPGDIVIVGFNTSTWGDQLPDCSNNQDNFAFIPLVDIQGGQELYFTDNGVKADGCLRTNEGIIKWTAPLEGVPKGTVVSIFTVDDEHCQPSIIQGPGGVEDRSLGTKFDMNVKGEQIIVFQDDGKALNCPDQYIFAVTNNGGWQSSADDSHTSIVPPGLQNGVSALALSNEPDFLNNARFDCSLAASGSKKEILSSVVNPDNWEGSTTTIYELPKCVFQFGDVRIQYITYDQMALSWDKLEPGDEMVIIAREGEPVFSFPAGDGSNLDADSAFGQGTDIGNSEFVVFKGDTSSQKRIIVNGLQENNEYFFKTFTHAANNGVVWEEGGTSIPSSEIAKVQDVTNFYVSNRDTGLLDFKWSNYDGLPRSEWWDGGVLILQGLSGPLNIQRQDLNALSMATDDFVEGEDLSYLGNPFDDVSVTYVNSDGDSSVTIDKKPGEHYFFKIFHQDGLISGDDFWSDGVEYDIKTRAGKIQIVSNSNVILPNDSVPEVINNTDFGLVTVSGSKTFEFIIENQGNGKLFIPDNAVSLTGDSVFQVSVQPESKLYNSRFFGQFALTFSPGARTGLFFDTVMVRSNDPDHPVYYFVIKGESKSGCFAVSPGTGTAGTNVTLRGVGFSGVTNVLFNGEEANYSIISDEVIKCEVPAGASTGNISVVPSGSVPNSCHVFKVIDTPSTCY